MNILITGGAGFIGSNLSQYYLQKKDKVTVIDNLLTGSINNIQPFLNNDNYRFLNFDLLDFNLDKLDNIDVIYHLASPASPKKYKKYPIETLMVNAYGTKKLLDYMIKKNSKTFVFASTSEVYGDPLVHPQIETYWGNVNPIGTRSCYDEAKRFAEALIMSYFRKYNLNIRIARIFNTYGSNMEKDDGRVISNFISQSLNNESMTIYGDGKQTRSFCYVSDMVKALYLLASKDSIKGEIINLGNPNEVTILKLADLIKSLIKSNSQFVFKKIDSDDPKKRKPDIGKAKKLLGWQPSIALENGLQKTIKYFKERYK